VRKPWLSAFSGGLTCSSQRARKQREYCKNLCLTEWSSLIPQRHVACIFSAEYVRNWPVELYILSRGTKERLNQDGLKQQAVGEDCGLEPIGRTCEGLRVFPMVQWGDSDYLHLLQSLLNDLGEVCWVETTLDDVQKVSG